jgi:hypothetical protein
MKVDQRLMPYEVPVDNSKDTVVKMAYVHLAVIDARYAERQI